MMKNKVQIISNGEQRGANIWMAFQAFEHLENPLQLLDGDGSSDLAKLPGNPTCLSVLDMKYKDPSLFRNVQTKTKIPFFGNWNSTNKQLCEYPDQTYHQSVVYPWYQEVKTRNEPQAHSVQARLCEKQVRYQRLIVPYESCDLLLVLYWVDFLVEVPVVSVAALSPRERECLTLLAGGYTAKQIAQILDLATRTIEHYIESARQKLSAKNTTHAVSMMLLHDVMNKDHHTRG